MSSAGPGQRPRPRKLRRVGGRPAGRTPFALLMVALLASGLIALLMLNTALDQGSFALSKLQKQTSDYTQEQQSLQQEIDRDSAPDQLAQRAKELGMVPGSGPAFLADNGTVLGSPSPLPGPPIHLGAGAAQAAASATPAGSPPPSSNASAAAGQPAASATPSAGATDAGGGLTLTASSPATTPMPTPTPTVVH